MTVTPSDVAAAVQQLADTGTPGIDRRIVAEVLQAHPHLLHAAHEWGWNDTEVRDGLFVHLWSHLTGGHPHAQLHPDGRVEEILRQEQIQAGQRAWLEREGKT